MDADRQLPRGGEIFLDHIGHFVRDPHAAGEALRRAGFAPTPVSVQADAMGQPTGTGNVTAMLERGYIEVLFKTADTEIGREFDRSVARYGGVHLVAFSVANPERAHTRLAAEGFKMRPLVNFSRPVETESGAGVAAFTVVRAEREEMAEGRVQMLMHRTEDTVWQKRWLSHPNGAVRLVDVLIATADVAEAAVRFARFTGRTAAENRAGRLIALDRGAVQLVSETVLAELLPGAKIPGVPFIAAYGLAVKSLATAEAALRQGGMRARRVGDALAVSFPEELGTGAWLLVEQSSALPWRS
jgi:hypothetical protein